MKAVLRIIVSSLLALVVAFAISAVVSDPYSSSTTVRSPFYTKVHDNGEIELLQWSEPTFLPPAKSDDTPINTFFIHLGYARAGARIVLYRYTGESKLKGDEELILRQIHDERFNPGKPYVITGGHYSDLYMRNLGVFYSGLLEPRLPTRPEDLQNRQRIALQTLAVDLAFLKANEHPVTTLSPLSGATFTGLNVYEYPSDSLYAVLYTLKELRRPGSSTTAAGQKLLEENREVLGKSLNAYLRTVTNQSTGLIRADIYLSSARDGVKRKSSFYDNVIAWKTVQLARELDIPVPATLEMNMWRQKIIDTYWQEDIGIFKDDIENTEFSADSLMAYSTQFLDPQNEQDRQKLQRIVSYIKTQQLDQPFPLKYSKSPQTSQFFSPVRFFAPAYMSDGIWSHWGIEYIKLLIALSPHDRAHLQTAQQHLQQYKSNIETYGGYPELYHKDGKPFSTPLLRAVLHTGWVVNYEQAKILHEDMRKQLGQ